MKLQIESPQFFERETFVFPVPLFFIVHESVAFSPQAIGTDAGGEISTEGLGTMMV